MQYILEKDKARPDIDRLLTVKSVLNELTNQEEIDINKPFTLPDWACNNIWYAFFFDQGYILNRYRDEYEMFLTYKPLTGIFINDIVKA